MIYTIASLTHRDDELIRELKVPIERAKRAIPKE